MASHGVTANLDGGARMLAYTKKLLKWGSTEELRARLTRKPPLNDRAAWDVEQDLLLHTVCAVACWRARHNAGVRTEESFLEEDLSSKMSPEDCELVKIARRYWRRTIKVEVAGRTNVKQWVLLVYRCILSGTPAEVAAAVSFASTQTCTFA